MSGGRAIWPLLLVLATASSAVAGEAVSFKADLVPLLKKRCAVCHLTGSEAGNMALHPRAAYGSLVGVASVQAEGMLRVAPGDPDASYLLHKLEDTHLDAGGTGARMPFNEAPLDPEAVQLFRAWIEAGAPEN